MKLLVGLGNTGAHFDGSRHNVGFSVLDTFATEHNLDWQHKDKYKADIAETTIDSQKVLLIKPTTFYNLSGEAVQAVMQFYKLQPSDVLVVHDELAMPLGTVRVRIGGSDAGNNGIKNIIAHLGEHFARIRVGIANEHTTKTDAVDFVLGHFSHAERQTLAQLQPHITDLLYTFVRESLEHTTIDIA